MMHKIKLPENEVILYALALAQTLGFAYAAIVYEGSNVVLMALAGARGVLLGAALSFGAAVAAQRAPRVASKRARQIGYLALGGLLVVSPLIMAPAIMAAFPADVRAILPVWAQWTLAAALAIAPDFVAIAVAAQSGSLQPQEAKQSELKAKPSESAPLPVAAVFACAHCQRTFASQNALNAHERSHKAKVVGYVATFEPVTKEGSGK